MPVKEMRLYIAAGIFVCMTVIKLLLPEVTATAREKVVAVINTDMDYQAVLTQMGSVLTREPVQQVIAALRGEEPVPVFRETETVAQMLAETVSILPENWVSSQGVPAVPTSTPLPDPTPTPEPTPDPVPERVRQAVSAFLETQAPYAAYDLPETVSYDYLEIPFDYTSPVSGITSSGFGYRLHPVEDVVKFHYGTDYAVNTGTDISVFADGTVTEVNWDDGYGNYIRVSHADGWSTLYAHCSETFVQPGQQVTKGERIALAGATGEVTGPHLHFELLHNGIYTNPEFFCG